MNLTLSEIPKTGFLASQPKYVHTQVNNFVSAACVAYKARSTHMDVMTTASSSSRQRRRRRRQRRQNFVLGSMTLEEMHQFYLNFTEESSIIK